MAFVWAHAKRCLISAAHLAPVADARVTVAKVILPCNFGRKSPRVRSTRANSSSPALVRHGARPRRRCKGDRPLLVASVHRQGAAPVERTRYGFRYAAIWRPIANASVKRYMRQTVFVAPATA